MVSGSFKQDGRRAWEVGPLRARKAAAWRDPDAVAVAPFVVFLRAKAHTTTEFSFPFCYHLGKTFLNCSL